MAGESITVDSWHLILSQAEFSVTRRYFVQLTVQFIYLDLYIKNDSKHLKSMHRLLTNVIAHVCV